MEPHGEVVAAMIPINQLLSRIRWDTEFARGEFEIGYYDRVEDHIIRVPFHTVEFPEDKPHFLRLFGTDAELHEVPFHRVREIYKDGLRIWHRPAEGQPES